MNCSDQAYTPAEIDSMAKVRDRMKQVEVLNWVLQVMGTGRPYGMIRIAIHNKIVELEGKGERA